MRAITFWLLLSVVAGCGPLTSSLDDISQPSPVAERASADEVWQALARSVDAGQITSTQRLAQFVVVLTRNGDLSASDVANFDTAFPGGAKTDRPLSADDVAKLKELK